MKELYNVFKMYILPILPPRAIISESVPASNCGKLMMVRVWPTWTKSIGLKLCSQQLLPSYDFLQHMFGTLHKCVIFITA